MQRHPIEPPNYTTFPNRLLDVELGELSCPQWRVLCYIVRHTFGWHKSMDAISYKQFLHGVTAPDGHRVDHGCGLSSPNALHRALESLESMGLIQAARRTGEDGRLLSTVYQLVLAPDEERLATAVNGTPPTIPGIVGSHEEAPPYYPGDSSLLSGAYGATIRGIETKETPTKETITKVVPVVAPGTSNTVGDDVRAPRARAREDPSSADESGTADPLWGSVLAQLEGEIAAEDYAALVATQVQSYQDGSLVLACPDAAAAARLGGPLHQCVLRAAMRVLDPAPTTLQFVAPPSTPPVPPVSLQPIATVALPVPEPEWLRHGIEEIAREMGWQLLTARRRGTLATFLYERLHHREDGEVYSDAERARFFAYVRSTPWLREHQSMVWYVLREDFDNWAGAGMPATKVVPQTPGGRRPHARETPQQQQKRYAYDPATAPRRIDASSDPAEIARVLAKLRQHQGEESAQAWLRSIGLAGEGA